MTDYESTYKNLKDTDSIAYLKPASLEHFLNHEIKSSFTIDWNQKLTILELGCGTGSLFEEGYESHHIIAIDISQTAINYAKQNNVNNIIFKESDLTKELDFKSNTFDFILDSHCLHCLTSNSDRTMFFENVKRLLGPQGVLSIESMIYHSEMLFDDQFRYKDNILYDNNNTAIRYIPSSRELEDEVLQFGFEICYLRVFESLKVIPNRERNIPLASDPDLLRMIIRRK